jgi:hypothetical protein
MAAALDVKLMGMKVHPASDTQADTVLYDKDGHRYKAEDGSDAVCVTEACIENTVALVNDQPASDKQLSYVSASGIGAVPFAHTGRISMITCRCGCSSMSAFRLTPTGVGKTRLSCFLSSHSSSCYLGFGD